MATKHPIAALAAALLGLVSTALAAESSRPNFILITADDLGPQLGYCGDPTIATPHLDRLALENVRFDHAYVCQASCSPSRSAMYTGLFPHQNGQIGLDTPFSMRADVLTLPKLLKDSGYRTGVLGKVHVAPASSLPWDLDKSQAAYIYGRKVKTMAADAREFFDGGSEPFFLKVSFMDPHHDDKREFPSVIDGLPERPIQPDEITRNVWTGQPVPSGNGFRGKAKTAGYYNTVRRLDLGVGMLLDELERSGKAENTMVIFLSDNGGGPVSSGKMTIDEAGTRLPFVIRYPRGQRGGQLRSEFVSAVDILPTILEAAEIPLPPALREQTTGRSLLPLIRGEPAPSDWRPYVFTEFTYHGATLYKPCRAVRDARYKLVFDYARIPETVKIATTEAWLSYVTAHPPEIVEVRLFDLQEDRRETRNLAADPALAAVRARLEGELKHWQRRTNDPLAR